jgi:hypothetical protein
MVEHNEVRGKSASQTRSHDSSVGIVLGCGLVDWGSRVPLLVVLGNFFHHHVQNGSGAHPASYPMGTKGSFPVGVGEPMTHLHPEPRSKNEWSYTSTPQ